MCELFGRYRYGCGANQQGAAPIAVADEELSVVLIGTIFNDQYTASTVSRRKQIGAAIWADFRSGLGLDIHETPSLLPSGRFLLEMSG